ncbi:PAS domain S-box protein [Ferrimonas pelagia]|uniref:GGDEF domain-containing protein n=1 Tax=Ferrimonas pelagia TaxID=1177826 RepID=A0ABP9EH71_9GAMM
MATTDQTQLGLHQVLVQADPPKATGFRHPPFALQIGLMVIFVVGVAFTLLHFNSVMLNERLASRRFAELQVFSDRINEALMRQDASLQLISQFSVLPFQTDTHGLGTEIAATFLEQLQQKLSRFQTVALLDDDSHTLLQVGQNPQMAITRRELQQQRSQLDPNEVYSSQLFLDSNQLAAYQWLLAPLRDNPIGASSILAVVDISDLWEGFHTLSDNGILPLLLVDQQSHSMNLTDPSKPPPGTLGERFPELWHHMQDNSFGQFSQSPYHFVYIQVRPDNESPLFLLSYIDERTSKPVEARYKLQFYLGTLALIVILARLMWHRRYQQDHRQGRQRAESLAEQLYQSNQAAMIFDIHGHCLSANKELCHQLARPLNRLDGRRFRHLFDSDPLSIDMIWQLARSSGYWEGQLFQRGKSKTDLKVNLRLLTLSPNEQMVLLRIEESPHQREQALRLRHMTSLSDCASGLALLDMEQTILACNPALARITGQPQDKLPGRSWQRFLPLVNADMVKSLNQQLNTRGYWQGPLWLQRDDGDTVRCLANVQLGDTSGGDEPYQVISLTPIQDPALVQDIQAFAGFHRQKISKALAQLTPEIASLMVLDLSRHDQITSFADADAMLFLQHKLLSALQGALPKEAIIGNETHPSELHILLPGWDDSKATRLAANLLNLLKDTEMDQQLVIGVALCDGHSEWETLLAHAHSAVQRAKLTGQAYCQAFTRHSA